MFQISPITDFIVISYRTMRNNLHQNMETAILRGGGLGRGGASFIGDSGIYITYA